MARGMYAAAHCGRSEARGQRGGGKQQQYDSNEKTHQALKHRSQQVKLGGIVLTEKAFQVFIRSPLSMMILSYSIMEAEATIKARTQEVSGEAWWIQYLCARYICVAAGTAAGL